jgi:hypothetical protein
LHPAYEPGDGGTPSIRAALERLVEIDDANSINGADPDTTAWTDAIGAARTALAQPEGKRLILQWTENIPPGEGCRYDHCIARTPFGRFLISWKGWEKFDSPTVDETPWGDWYNAFNSVDEAKAACQKELDERFARWGHPATPPAPPAPEAGEVGEVGEVGELGTLLRVGGSCGGGAALSPEQCRRTATLLQQQEARIAGLRSALADCGRAVGGFIGEDCSDEFLLEVPREVRLAVAKADPVVVPVAVSERLPGEEDCDAGGKCWIGTWSDIDGEPTFDWAYTSPKDWTWQGIASIQSWIPAHAIPLPQAGEVEG